ncbi:MAG: extracellular solute-binding protein, partial [Clostridiales bacterium]|nr:extracellular solute-binding protein [Clostridiales bacterium]
VGGALYAYGIDSHLRDYLKTLTKDSAKKAAVFTTTWISRHSINLIKKGLGEAGIPVVDEALYVRGKPGEAQLKEALDLLIKQKANVSPAYGVDNLKDKMASGELSASIAWSGDHIVMLDRIEELGGNDNIDLKFVLPAGSNWSVDMMCVPTNCQNYEGAMDFINFMYDPQIAFENCEYVGYSTPNTAAKDMLDPEVSGNIYYYPTSDVFATLEVYYTSEKIEEKYTEIWNTVKASA